MQQEVMKKKHDPHWPKWKYHKDGKAKIVHSKAAEDLLGKEWKDSPADHGHITHPHSDEYLAEKQFAADMEKGIEEPVQPDPPLVEEKPRRGRPPKQVE